MDYNEGQKKRGKNCSARARKIILTAEVLTFFKTLARLFYSIDIKC